MNKPNTNKSTGSSTNSTSGKKSGRGFAGMSPEKHREASRKGGENSHGGAKRDNK